jgi:NitT/TauT family transport system substrate-binding protein
MVAGMTTAPRSTTTRRSQSVSALMSLVVLASGCRASRAPEDRLVVADVAEPAFALVLVAEQKRFFADEHLATEWVHFELGRDSLAALLQGRAHVAMAYLTPVVARSFENSHLRILTTLHHAHENTRVVARADRNIHAASDLRGKRIGLPRSTSAEFFLQTLLTLAAVPPEEVQMVDLPLEKLPDALADGSVDAVATWSPVRGRARRALAGSAVEISSRAYTETSVLFTRDDILDSRRHAIGCLLRALARAERLVQEAPGEALAILRHRFPSEPAEDLDDQWAEIVPHLGLHNILVTALEREADFFRARQGSVRPAPDFKRLLAPQPLLDVIPEAVTVPARRQAE